MNHSHSLRLTPSNSPFFKTSTPRSPTKARHEEPGLRLKKVIGTTTASTNGFDSLPSARQFVYTAGAAAVVCTVGDDLKVTQRFFRARPTAGGTPREVNGVSGVPQTPTDPRNRVLGSLRESVPGGSPLAASTRDWSESPTGKSATAKDRVKAATSVALSPNGKWLALGEMGYKPRILIFSNKGESSEAPICALAEHTFGVHALAFSPNSKYLASLGTVNDGFLYIWAVDDRTGSATLQSSNKCTVVVNQMLWVGRSLLTVGLRFVKCWKPDEDGTIERRNADTTNGLSSPKQRTSDFGNSILSPKHKFLPGKNCLLGDLIDSNFVSAVALSDDRAIVCTDAGDVCVLSDCHGAQTLVPTAQVPFHVTAAFKDDEQRLVVHGRDGQVRRFGLDSLGSPLKIKTNRRQTISPAKMRSISTLAPMAVAALGPVVVELDSMRRIKVSMTSSAEDSEEQTDTHQLAAHNDSVLGVQCYTSVHLPSAAFLTFSTCGSIHIWSADGDSVAELEAPVQTFPEMYDVSNELRAVASSPDGAYIAAADKYGTLSILNSSNGETLSQVRAHSAEVADVTCFQRDGVQLIATASRDRTVQLFRFVENQLDLLQTMDEHAAAVTGLLVVQQGGMLLSSSTDRTIVVREAVHRTEDPPSVAFAILRTITLKSSPTSMCLNSDDGGLLVATADRCINSYNLDNGQAGFSFKCSDAEGGEATAMSRILYAPSLNGNPTIVGISSADKSVRLYSEYGSLIARDWGHTEGITDVALLEGKATEGSESRASSQVITVAADSTIFMWDTVSRSARSVSQQHDINGVSESSTNNKLSTPIGPPLRKVLSLSELHRSKRARPVDDNGQESPPGTSTPTQAPLSPQRLKKKTSRMSMVQAPRLEPPFRSSFAESSRRRSLRKRSPSPPSPRNTAKRDLARRPSLGMSLRSKSSENMLSTIAASSATGNSGFGSINASTESVCRTLRAYRKKLAKSSDTLSPETLRELEKELKLTARVVGERSQGKTLDEAMVAKLLDEASEKIVSRLDERIKERVESEVRKSGEGSPIGADVHRDSIAECPDDEGMEAVAGALQKVVLTEK